MAATEKESASTSADICEYAYDEHRSAIVAVMKRLFNDFIVTEVCNDGRALQATKTTTANFTESSQNEEVNELKNENLFVNSQSDDDKTQIPTEFHAKLDEIRKLKLIASGEIKQCSIELKEFPKDVRKKLYQFIANNFGDQLFTTCDNGLLTVRRSNGKADTESRKRRYWPAEQGDYLHFTMTKENIDTHSAIWAIAKKTGLKPSIFSVSGTKDRRAVTTQRVSVYRVDKSKLVNLRIRGIWLSQFSYSDKKLQLGDNYGNRFSIILRDIPTFLKEDDLRERIDKWEHHGFLNYFGSQRFGSCGVNTAEVGRCILAENWQLAVQMLLAQREEAKVSIKNCLKFFVETGNAKEAIQLLPFGDNSVNIERTLLMELAKSSSAYKAAILALPRDVRTMYIHAYQSSVFNRIVSRRKRTFGLTILAGDLKSDGTTVNNPDDANNIEEVCLPLPSIDTEMPQNEIKKWYDEIAHEDGVKCESFQKIERQFGIGSIYRPFLLKPKDVKWELIQYSAPTEVLQRCEFIPDNWYQQKERNPIENCFEDDPVAENKPFRALKIQFDLPPGTYATVALRELMRTDFSKESQKAIEAELKRK